jgi:enoyl-CoA hydratase/carnithine racemase
MNEEQRIDPSGTRQSPSSLVTLEVNDGIASITINRPAALNSLNPAVVFQLQLKFDEAAGDARVRGIVLGGAGKAFVVGADLEFFVRNLDSGEIDRIIKFTEAGHRLLNAIDECPKPVVARVGGAALGAGTEIALACDFVVASHRASFGLPETSLGIYPGLGGTQRGPRALGLGIAKWLIFTAKTISAKDALAIGLAHQLVADDRLDAFCEALADGRAGCDERPEKSAELEALEQFFGHARVDDLLAGSADAGGNPALLRAMKQVAGNKSWTAEWGVLWNADCSLSYTTWGRFLQTPKPTSDYAGDTSGDCRSLPLNNSRKLCHC